MTPGYANLRLRDRIQPGLRVLFVGINPGVRSALTGHHFAGYSNRFWKLLHESGLVPDPITYEDDDRLPEWGYGVTNLIARPSPGIDVLEPAEYLEGWTTLSAKVRRYRPQILALVGVTAYRAILPLLDAEADGSASGAKKPRARTAGSVLGLQPYVLHGTRVFVLPNPSGRNANYSYREMLGAFRKLRKTLSTPTRQRPNAQTT